MVDKFLEYAAGKIDAIDDHRDARQRPHGSRLRFLSAAGFGRRVRYKSRKFESLIAERRFRALFDRSEVGEFASRKARLELRVSMILGRKEKCVVRSFTGSCRQAHDPDWCKPRLIRTDAARSLFW